MATSNETVGTQADQTGWPLLKSDRKWGRYELFVVLLVAAAAT